MARRIVAAHDSDRGDGLLHLKFDALTSHDITYVAVLQTAIASGLEKFPVPYVLTNCHNSLCAVGGTINEDDHMFGLTAARKFGGIFVPRHLAVIHQYMREAMAKSGGMILGTDSHTRYGALGTLSVGEGGPAELDGKQMGVYRATEELYYAVELRCPHLGCRLEWNPDDKSWDCPCHGSRFDVQGRCLTEPAQTDLPACCRRRS